jgi:cation:H+ antiporter
MFERFWWWKIALAALAAMPAVALRALGCSVPPLASVLIYGGAVVASSFLLCWAAEAVQQDISASLATAILALIAILPEYAIDLYFAFTSGRHPGYARFAAANMTGSNRLLLGLGWPLMLFLLMAWGRRSGRPVTELDIKPSRRVELGFLGLVSLYALSFPLRRGIHWTDGVVLMGFYALYVWRLSREERREPALTGTAGRLGALPWWRRRLALTVMFLWSAGVVVLAAKPFADALVNGGRALGLDEFLLVQWVAPLSTEAPEFLVAGLLALRGDSDTALGTLLSSKVNQWTLLVGSLPLAHLLGGGGTSLPFDARQVEEFWLTSAQTLMGFAMLTKLNMKRWEAVTLLALFAVQFPLTGPHIRMILAGIYFILAAGLLWAHRRELPGLFRALRLPPKSPGAALSFFAPGPLLSPVAGPGTVAGPGAPGGGKTPMA